MFDPLRTAAERPAPTAPQQSRRSPTRAEPLSREREGGARERPEGMVPARERRRSKVERGLMRLVATGGIVGIAVLLGAVLVGQDVAGWIVGLVDRRHLRGPRRPSLVVAPALIAVRGRAGIGRLARARTGYARLEARLSRGDGVATRAPAAGPSPTYEIGADMSTSDQKVMQYLNEAHATELALVRVLQSQIAMTPRGSYREGLERHLDETRDHAERVSDRLEELGQQRQSR